ncbi:hypothetical protein [Amorphus orientalis]|uniref:Uncharacterized protein n=1 Tax=Amorphus orientalis TaxID=649198 RepID=A0AAE4AUB8_9HYPH|nr:hypothetical protein [Amorphus orientalis]MDQ0316962.1 hypothetical protein [Amorphus orientalis]
MYTMFNEAHTGLAQLALLFTVAWAVVAATVPAGISEIRGWRKSIYIAAMAVTGVVGLSGLVIMVMGSWYAFGFVWLGLLAIVLHGLAGTRSRKAAVAGAKGRAVGMAAAQIVFLVVAYGLMTVRPF